MKILTQGALPTATCKVCDTKFQYNRTDTHNIYRKRFHGLISQQVTFVYCPCCEYPVEVKHQKNL